jgi:hypothetical protein
MVVEGAGGGVGGAAPQAQMRRLPKKFTVFFAINPLLTSLRKND